MVGFSGTGGGFRASATGETQISNASRHIKEDERELCEENGVEYLELQIAIDGLAVVVTGERRSSSA
jgi:phosphate transport system substrate-binding protein